jgi:predicted nucleic acid-binding protein
MNFLLDTNVVSEWVKPKPDPNVVRWLAAVDEDHVCISVVTFAEIRQGIYEMSPGKRRDALESWAERDLLQRFEGRILPIDLPVAQAWSALMAQSTKLSINLNIMDAFLAATAKVHALTLATRNTRHFAKLDVALTNPWRDAASLG